MLNNDNYNSNANGNNNLNNNSRFVSNIPSIIKAIFSGVTLCDNLYDSICSYKNLLLAYKKAKKKKSLKPYVMEFNKSEEK